MSRSKLIEQRAEVVGAGGRGRCIDRNRSRAGGRLALVVNHVRRHRDSSRSSTRRVEGCGRGVAGDRTSGRAVAVGQRTILRADTDAVIVAESPGATVEGLAEQETVGGWNCLNCERSRAVSHRAGLIALGDMTLCGVVAGGQVRRCDVGDVAGAGDRTAVRGPGVAGRLLGVQIRRRTVTVIGSPG